VRARLLVIYELAFAERSRLIRRDVEGRLGKKARAAQKDLPALLARSTRLPSASF